jgi:molybdopterin/thiamine biosynthesis adenylyltransferase
MQSFDYGTAFSRNIGWLTPEEQLALQRSRVAIAGLGGAGGGHLLSLSRLGVGHFNIADFDRFELPNFNRQVGATISHLNQPKTEVLRRLALDINPDLDVVSFPEGIHPKNMDSFLKGVDLYVDGLDFFALDARRAVFAACRDRAIPAVTVAPLGMGAALLYFDPAGMSFEHYFRLEGRPPQEQLVRLMAGLSPRMLQTAYLAFPSAVNFAEHRAPSTPMGCELCAGIMGTEVLKILLKRGPIKAAPWGLHFDAYRQKLVRTWRPLGNANPIQLALIKLIRYTLSGRGKRS